MIRVNFNLDGSNTETDLGYKMVLSKNLDQITYNSIFRFYGMQLFLGIFVICVVIEDRRLTRPCYKIWSCAFSNPRFWRKLRGANLFNTTPDQSNLLTIYFTSIVNSPLRRNDCLTQIIINNIQNQDCIQNDELVDNGYKETYALGSRQGYNGNLHRCSNLVHRLTAIYGNKLREFIEAKIHNIAEC